MQWIRHGCTNYMETNSQLKNANTRGTLRNAVTSLSITSTPPHPEAEADGPVHPTGAGALTLSATGVCASHRMCSYTPSHT